MTERFRYYLRVRYNECDAQKVVFNARYGDYVDLGATEFLAALGFRDVLINGSFDYQLVKQTHEWKAPARFDDVLELSIYAKHLGNTSFTLVTEFRLAGDARVITTSETVYVMMKAHTLEKTPIPPPIRAALEQGAQGKVVDHAGYLASNSGG
jgi:acyl-CoA thioester hydrolase